MAQGHQRIIGRRGNAALPGLNSRNWHYFAEDLPDAGPLDLHDITALEKEGGHGQMETGKKELRSRIRQRELMRAQSLFRLRARSSHFVPIIFPVASAIRVYPAKSGLKKYAFSAQLPHSAPPVQVSRSTLRQTKSQFPSTSYPTACTAVKSGQTGSNQPLLPPRRRSSSLRIHGNTGRRGNAALSLFYPLISWGTSLLYSPPEPCVCRCSFRLRKEVNV